MIVGTCKDTVKQERYNMSIYNYISQNINDLLKKINCNLEYQVYAIFFDNNTYKNFSMKNHKFPNKWLEILPYEDICNLEVDINNIVANAYEETIEKYKNILHQSQINTMFYASFYSKLAVEMFTDKNKSLGHSIIVSQPISSYNFKAQNPDILGPNTLEDNCVIVVKYKSSTQMDMLKKLLNKHCVGYTGLYSSFFEASISEFFRYFTNEIYKVKYFNEYLDLDNIIATAGKNFMCTISNLLNCDAENSKCYLEDAPGIDKTNKQFVYNIEKISDLSYEKSDAFGTFLFASQRVIEEVMAKYSIVTFDNPCNLYEHKLIRKILQIVSKDLCLLSTTEKVYGIIKRSDLEAIVNNKDENIFFEVNVENGRVWNIKYMGGKKPYLLLKSEYNTFMYTKPKVDYDTFHNAIANVFSYDIEKAKKLECIVEQILGQIHGTMIVFSKNAEYEAKRLHKSCIPIKKINLTNTNNIDIIRFITSIDGAILCDGEGNCYAIGVILDGSTSEEHEDISRGARYNSASRYHFTRKDECVIVVLSEDKYVTVI